MITVLVCTRNRPKELAECLLAVRRQVRSPDGVIVVDGSYADQVKALVEGFGMRYVRQTGRGIAQARNQGIDNAIGDIIAFVDDDCVPAPNWLVAIEEFFRRMPKGVVGGYWFTRNAEKWVSRCFGYRYEIKMRDPREHRAPHVPASNMSVSREVLQILKGFDENLPAAEDIDFCYRATLAGFPVHFSPRMIVHHSQRDTLRSLVRQHYTYGVGAARATQKHWKDRRWLVSYGWKVALLPPLWILAGIAAMLLPPLWWLAVGTALVLPAWVAREALRHRGVLGLSLAETGRCLVVGLVFRMAFLTGFYRGLLR